MQENTIFIFLQNFENRKSDFQNFFLNERSLKSTLYKNKNFS